MVEGLQWGSGACSQTTQHTSLHRALEFDGVWIDAGSGKASFPNQWTQGELPAHVGDGLYVPGDPGTVHVTVVALGVYPASHPKVQLPDQPPARHPDVSKAFAWLAVVSASHAFAVWPWAIRTK